MRNEYRLPEHRFQELKHFCLQYPTWQQLYHELIFMWGLQKDSDPTATIGRRLADYARNMTLVEKAAEDTSFQYQQEILEYVTTGRRSNIDPLIFKDLYMKFFYRLNTLKGI